jgi:hypothetical protein
MNYITWALWGLGAVLCLIFLPLPVALVFLAGIVVMIIRRFRTEAKINAMYAKYE